MCMRDARQRLQPLLRQLQSWQGCLFFFGCWLTLSFFFMEIGKPSIIFLSFTSMILGAFAALVQTDLKRLLAYSAIGQMGYVLLGLLLGMLKGLKLSLFI